MSNLSDVLAGYAELIQQWPDLAPEGSCGPVTYGMFREYDPDIWCQCPVFTVGPDWHDGGTRLEPEYTLALCRSAALSCLGKVPGPDGYPLSVCNWEGRDYRGEYRAQCWLVDGLNTNDESVVYEGHGPTLDHALQQAVRAVKGGGRPHPTPRPIARSC